MQDKLETLKNYESKIRPNDESRISIRNERKPPNINDFSFSYEKIMSFN